jgi:hypothetical protein
LRIEEVGVPRVYLDPNRAFGGVLNDAEQRLAYYRKIIDNADRVMQESLGQVLTCSGSEGCR